MQSNYLVMVLNQAYRLYATCKYCWILDWNVGCVVSKQAMMLLCFTNKFKRSWRLTCLLKVLRGNIAWDFSSTSSSNSYILTIPWSAVRNERILPVVWSLHMAFYWAGWPWEQCEEFQEQPANALVSAMSVHLQASVEFSLERHWGDLHLKWLSTGADQAWQGRWAGRNIVGNGRASLWNNFGE